MKAPSPTQRPGRLENPALSLYGYALAEVRRRRDREPSPADRRKAFEGLVRVVGEREAERA